MRLLNKSSIWAPVLKAGAAGAINRFAGTGIRLFSTPLIINYLGIEKYGFWITISSIAGYILLLDLGISSAMLNKLTKFYTEEDYESADRYIFSNLLFFTVISLLIFVIAFILIPNLDWVNLLKLKVITNSHEIHTLLIVCIVIFLIKLSTTIILKIPFAMQNGSLSEMYLLTGNLMSFLGILISIQLDLGLLSIVIFLTSGNLIASILITIHLFFTRKIKFYRIRMTDVLLVIKDLQRTGYNFIIIQLTGILIVSSQFSLLAHYQGAERVAGFGIMFQVMLAIQIPILVLQQPLWSKFAQLNLQNDTLTIKSALKKYIRYSIFYSGFIALVLIVFIPYLLPLVIHEHLDIPLNLRIGFSIYSAFVLIFGGFTVGLFAMNLTRQMAIVSIIQCVVFFIGANLAVPSFGGSGMIAVLILMHVVTIPILLNVFKQKVFN
ncbi:lipopolysaccharide biosynthesis protein [Pedobacter metabolipauper]|uniref:O-antigen/teichoic acid export membrane protein n=1 Tax=Pedobacter metabolipauper TaxID=425513 RepID=A0A4V3D1A9_9SPHI|nr:hypothetical protein [Pedobacter metabolipauper]TDQ09947.1 O-antigen/teichoic acid export membrane protein [Pedobacter metabolipauper]